MRYVHGQWGPRVVTNAVYAARQRPHLFSRPGACSKCEASGLDPLLLQAGIGSKQARSHAGQLASWELEVSDFQTRRRTLHDSEHMKLFHDGPNDSPWSNLGGVAGHRPVETSASPQKPPHVVHTL